MKFNLINWGLIAALVISVLCWIAAGWGLCLCLSGCQRTDYQYEFKDGRLLYISNTSWATDSSSQKIVIDPNGTATVIGYGKREDRIKGNYNLVTGVTVETGE